MFKRILVPLDGSTRAERAIPVAARIARAGNGPVVLGTCNHLSIYLQSLPGLSSLC